MRFHLIRHARTRANTQGALSCVNDEPLDEYGLEQARRLSEYLSQLSFTQIWCSPLPRARLTIKDYVDTSTSEPEILPELCEGQLNLDYQAPVDKPSYEYDRVIGFPVPVQPESIGQFRGRVFKVMEKLKSADSTDTIVVITHGHFIREFLNMLMASTAYCRFPVGNCSDTLIEYCPDLVVRYINRGTIQQPHAVNVEERHR